MQVNDDSALSQSAKDSVYKSYPNARRAHLKTGGNFPYLSRSTEVNLYIQVTCTEFVDKQLEPCGSYLVKKSDYICSHFDAVH